MVFNYCVLNFDSVNNLTDMYTCGFNEKILRFLILASLLILATHSCIKQLINHKIIFLQMR